jgi:molybdopterin/thiamine biosynthesis adenylyltransferase
MKTAFKKHILLIGAGGLCHAALPSILDLPFEKMTIMDGDVVTEEPLSRQWLFTKNDLNQFKVVVLQKWISDRNSNKLVAALPQYFDDEIDFRPDLVFDFTDRLVSKQSIMRFCQKHKIPLIHAASQKNHGAVAFLHPESQLYRHLLITNQTDSQAEISCQDGVTTSVIGNIGIQAAHLGWMFFQNKRIHENINYFEGVTNEWSQFSVNNIETKIEQKSIIFHNAFEVVEYVKHNKAVILFIGIDDDINSCLPSELRQKIESLDSDIILTCQNGNEAVTAAKFLSENYNNIFAFSGKAEALKIKNI